MTASTRLVGLMLPTLLALWTVHASTVRLYFENATTGQTNTGALSAIPGDEIHLHFVFHGNPSLGERWSLLQITLCTGGNQVLEGSPEWSGGGFGSWSTQVMAAFQPSGTYPTRVAYSGTLYDDGIDPSNSRDGLLAPASSGLYALIGVAGSHPESMNIDVVVFRFHAGSAVPGTPLSFGFAGRDTDSGLSSRVLGSAGGTIGTVGVPDNYV